MKKIIANGLLILSIVFMTACSNGNGKADAYGNFEVDEITISAKTQGELLAFDVMEGESVNAGEVVGFIDTTKLHLQRAELSANLNAVEAQSATVHAQLKVAKDELARLKKDQARISNMYDKQAATQKQLDDINSAVQIATNNLQVLESQYPTIAAQAETVRAKYALLEQQLKDAVITNPVAGTVLTKFVQTHEVIPPGKPLYTIAPIENLYLRAYVTGDQLTSIALGQNVEVLVDGAEGEMIAHQGEISWISSQAEFTPKNIQTKDERVAQVYAIKVRVQNDGSLKIGMPGEVNFNELKIESE